MKELTFAVDGMCDNHCRNAVEGALNGLVHVEEAEVNLNTDSVTVRFDSSEVNKDDFREAVEEAGPYTLK